MATFGLTAADLDKYVPGQNHYSDDPATAAQVLLLMEQHAQDLLIQLRQQGWACDESDVVGDDELLTLARRYVECLTMADLESSASGQDASIAQRWDKQAAKIALLIKTHTESLSEDFDSTRTRGTPVAMKIGRGKPLDTLGRSLLGGKIGRRRGAKGRF